MADRWAQSPDTLKGFRLIAEDPELYNKWLFTAPNRRGYHRLFALSRRACPFTNRPYAGASVYDEHLGNDQSLIPLLRPHALSLLGLDELDPPEQLIRGAIGRRDSYSQIEWNTVPAVREVMQREMTPGQLAEERNRVSWLGRDGPMWRDGAFSARFARPADLNLVDQYQGCLNLDLRLGNNPAVTRRGIANTLDHLGRHNFLAVFTFGGFVLLECDGRPVGCAWSYRSFDPIRAGWTIWVRNLFVPPPDRRRAACSRLLDAAVGLFAEAGFPARVRTVAVSDSGWLRSLVGRGFTRSPDQFVYFNR